MMKKEKNPRFLTIDLMRGFAMLIVIVTHTTVYFLSKPGITTFWNYIHFAVPIFVFCSGYVLLSKYQSISSIKEYFLFLRKRLSRLLLPFYIFLIPLFMLEILTNRFSLVNIPKALVALYPDIAWLVLLFIQLTILYPFFIWLIQRKVFFIIWLGFAGLVSVLFLITKFPLDYRYIMVIPWTIPFLLGYVYHKVGNKPKIVWLFTLYFGILFLTQHILLQQANHNLILQHNKYPPNIFYLSYGLFWLSFLYQLFGNSTVQHKTARILSFFSIYSYPLYFIHYLLIMIVFYQKIITFNVWGFTIIVLFGSILIQIILNKLLLNKPNKT